MPKIPRKSFLTPKIIIDKLTQKFDNLCPSKPNRTFKPTLKYGSYGVLSHSQIPDHINKPPYGRLSNTSELYKYYSRETPFAEVKTEQQISLMKKAAKLAAKCLKLCIESTKIGVTGEDIDRIGHDFIVENGAYPAGVNFHGFPKAICISVNEVACHGIPNLRPFSSGDIVSYDCTVYLNGVFGDCAGTTIVGDVSDEIRKLVRVSKECLDIAIENVRPGIEFSRLAKVVTAHAEKHGFSVLREFGGHFIGEMMHMHPMIGFCYPSSTPGCMVPGQTFTIEPILCQGSNSIYTWDDGWTIATVDNGFCSQFEHTVLVTDSGCDIITIP
ncbi:methionine aminopeptidase, putative [Theileria equi strain WA]|uniref:Methionine aminopeptidase n=1 Tax=Theileria equi strain WA TaxID=1537102 RepID=L0B308_THEEQ|nr:methionine aminopeptidase, putative [Theileria equi strain WA]AFZ81611.1 methionine aminopeptidase, putative [Theileria equi strain WA]|eukprot:XP_004831277.1 methionine aminopeptidase, putative [Theileria equi strain WA]